MALFFEKKYNTLIQNIKDTNMGQINRDDMLELTRRFTSARSNLVIIAGAYIDEEARELMKFLDLEDAK